jgi:hypothetical protein
MSDDPNVEFLRGIYSDWAHGRYRRADIWDPAVEFVTDYPELRTYHGPDGVREGWLYWLASWDEFTTKAEEFIPAGTAATSCWST